MQIQVSAQMRQLCPDFCGIAVVATVRNTPYCAPLWDEIATFTRTYQARYTIDSIKSIATIQATRDAYKRCGKDPSRYRPSGEALCRRLLRGLDLYKIDTLVDLINLVSIATGYSIGGFDGDKIVGDTLVLGIGTEGEPYEGIGRGTLNIAHMPVYRDALGGIGTPTSDHERTKLTLDTTHLVAIINGYSGAAGLDDAAAMLQTLLRHYAHSDGGIRLRF